MKTCEMVSAVCAGCGEDFEVLTCAKAWLQDRGAIVCKPSCAARLPADARFAYIERGLHLCGMRVT